VASNDEVLMVVAHDVSLIVVAHDGSLIAVAQRQTLSHAPSLSQPRVCDHRLPTRG